MHRMLPRSETLRVFLCFLSSAVLFYYRYFHFENWLCFLRRGCISYRTDDFICVGFTKTVQCSYVNVSSFYVLVEAGG